MASFVAVFDACVLYPASVLAYPTDLATPCKGYGENCLWIITEADRSVTTFLLPDEY